MELKVSINADEILAGLANDVEEIAHDIHEGVKALSAITHAHVVEEASKRLHARRETFINALKYEEIDAHTWAITVPAEALWIEDGMDAHSMVSALLAGAAKRGKLHVAKDGSQYAVVPFKHSDASRHQGPSKSSAFAKQLSQQVRTEMRKRGIAYQKPLERDASGKPKLGVLHSFSIMNSPKRPHWTSPALQGVRVYQQMAKGKRGEDVVERNVMTFRMVSSKHEGSKWQHPGLQPMHFLDEAAKWAMNEWIYTMLPEILKKYGIK